MRVLVVQERGKGPTAISMLIPNCVALRQRPAPHLVCARSLLARAAPAAAAAQAEGDRQRIGPQPQQ